IDVAIDFGLAIIDVVVEVWKMTSVMGLLSTTVGDSMPTWQEFRDGVLEAIFGAQFFLAKFPEYVQLYFDKAKLFVVEFTNKLVHLFTVVIPKAFGALGDLLSDVGSGKLEGSVD